MNEENLVISDKILAELVDKWFKLHGHKEKAFTRNILGKTIRKNMDRLDHWKLKGRGRNKKGVYPKQFIKDD